MSVDSSSINFGEVDNAVQAFENFKKDVEEEMEGFVSEYLSNAGLAYKEGSDIYPYIHDAVDVAENKFRDAMDGISVQGQSTQKAGELAQETETSNRNMINAHIDENTITKAG